MTTTKPPSRTRRLRKFLLISALTLLALLLLIPPIGGRLLRPKLQWMISSHLHAQLDSGAILYLPPYGLLLWNATLTTHAPDGSDIQLLHVSRLHLKLAQLPSKSRPLVIERLTFTHPTVHIVNTPKKIFPQSDIVIHTEDQPSPSAAPAPKVSDMFRLRHCTIDGGKVAYEDRTKPNSPPMTWSRINVNVETVPQSPSAYTFNLKIENAPILDLASSGSFDIDSLHLRTDTLNLTARAETDGPRNPLPPQIQQILRQYQIAGQLHIESSADATLTDLSHATFKSNIQLKDAHAAVSQWHATLDKLSIAIEISRDTQSGPIVANLQSLDAFASPIRLNLDSASFIADAQRNRWQLTKLAGRFRADPSPATQPNNIIDRLHPSGSIDFTAAASGSVSPSSDHPSFADYELLAYPHNISFTPPNFLHPFTDIIGGPIRASGGGGASVVTFENLVGHYDKDQWLATSARIPLTHSPDGLHINEIAGAIVFDRRSTPYPKGFGKLIEQLRPSGSFSIAGDLLIKPPPPKTATPQRHTPRTEFQLKVSSDHASLLLTDLQIPLNEIQGDAVINRDHADIQNLTAQSLGGTITLKSKIYPPSQAPPSPTQPRSHPVSHPSSTPSQREGVAYAAEISARDIDMEKISQLYLQAGKNLPSGSSKLTGRCFANADLTGDSTGLGSLAGNGEIEIINGNFMDFPLFQDIQSHAKTARDALTASQFAATFDFANSKVHLKEAAVSAPVLGLQGTGTVSFNGELNLRVVAAPLADWRDKIKQTNIPIVSNVAGELLGAFQKIINSATQTLLYEFKVTGPASQPKVETIPVPALSLPAAHAFSSMLDNKNHPHLLDALKKSDPDTH